mmetsp:Transcript_24765/g.66813  ORF Transcript_24765/g.66813 Transcript_24765/m.66813 type:complete len:109 (-) Transcript_24765:46-372(-)
MSAQSIYMSAHSTSSPSEMSTLSKRDTDSVSISKRDCLALAKALSTQESLIPPACQRYLAHKETQNKAWEGASLKDKVSGITRSHTGRQNHMQLQRRLTNPRIANHHK